MKRWVFAVLAVALGGVVLPASAAPPPQPDVALEIREGKRPFPEFLRQLEKKGHPKLRGDRQVRKILRDMKRRRGEDAGIQSFPAPGDGLFDGRAPAAMSPAPPALGPVNALALLASFSDVPPWQAADYFDTLVFGFDGTEFGAVAPSLTHYYGEVSGGSLSVVTEHLPSTIQCAPGVGPCTVDSPRGWLPLPQNKATYKSDLRAMLVDAVAAADNDVDFSSYDNNADGFVDYLVLVHAGTGGEWSGDDADIWSQTVSVAPVETADGVSIDTFMTVPEYWFISQYGRMTIGVYVHEFGHLLGLPDLYDYGLDSKGIGDWGLMGLGMWNGANSRGESPSWPGAWSRVALGWVVPETPLSDLSGAVLTPVGQGGPVYYLWDYGDDNSEFFLIENRRRLAGTYDAYLPGQGLLIWHIDENMPNNNPDPPIPSDQNDCNWPSHFRVALQQADGFMNLERNVNDGDIGDPYPGSYSITAFSPTSTADFPPRTPPNSGSYADCSSLVAVRNILALGDNIQADLEVSGPPVGSILIDDGAESTNSTAVTLSLSASMTGGVGLGSMRFRNGGVELWDDWEPYQSTKAWTLTAGDGTKTVYAQFKDYLGYISDSDPVTPGEQPYEDTIMFEAPGTVTINGGAAATRRTTVALALTPPAAGAVRMCVSNTASCGSWTTFAATRSWRLPRGSGVKTVNVWFRDKWRNTSAAPVSDTILLDTRAPTNGTVTVTPGDKQLTLDWSGFTDAHSGIVRYRAVFKRGSPPPSCSDGRPVPYYDGTSTTLLHTGLTNGTVYGYRICAIDAVGRRSSGATKTGKPVPETNPPTGTVTITVNGIAAAATRSTSVKLLLTAADDSSGTIRMCVSNTASCGSWTTFAATKSWRLTRGSGDKTVNVWFRDKWGNRSAAPVSDTILLDTRAPTNGTVTVTPGDRQLTLDWSGFSDAHSGIVRYRAVFRRGSPPPSCSDGKLVPDYEGTATTLVHADLTNGTVYGYRICAIDAVGRRSSGATKTGTPGL